MKNDAAFLNGGSNINKAIKINRKITLALLIISFIGFIFNCVFYILLHKSIAAGMDIWVLTENMSIYAGAGLVFLFLFHISAIITVVLELKVFIAESALRSFIFFLSIVSLIMIFGDFALLGDIIKEYNAGLLEGIYPEFLILYFSQALHLIFYMFAIILLAITGIKPLSMKDSGQALKDEAIFIDVQYVGIFTSVMGLLILAVLSIFTPLWAIRKGIVILCIMLVFPYAMIVIYWIVMKIRERISEWYDEKQFHDVTKASFITLLSSMVILASFFLIQNLCAVFEIMNVIWFPLYFFAALLIFSSIILHLNKKAGR